MKQKYFLLLIFGLFALRIAYGVVSEFWGEDEEQIYLIGLKSYTTQTWPFYGPDIVYTQTQIPGALQGLLVSAPLYIVAIPEAPLIFLGILSCVVLGFFALYLSKRFTDIPKWLIWTIVLTSTWVMHFSTRVVNPSYVILFSVPFFVCFIEIIDVYKNNLIKKGLCFFVLGIATTMVMQIHMSWVLFLPFTGFAFLYILKSGRKNFIKYGLYYLLGASIGVLTLLPTLLFPDARMGSVGSNIVFVWKNILNIPVILTRFLSFAAYEIPYMMGTSTKARMAVVENQLWMAPFAAFLYLVGFAQVALYIFGFFQKNENNDWKKIKWMTFFSYILIFLSFFFSIKGPSPHTFYIMLPVAMIYSFYCYRWLMHKHKVWGMIIKAAAISGIFFHIGLGIDSYHNKSLYKDRAKVQEAIDKKDYKILGKRRTDDWGYGY
ncbi:MAG: hypothetical protein NT150_02865 [Bacteroidetes bacterium]|nr:hypothetical protein [Bacteroidota bacterium]